MTFKPYAMHQKVPNRTFAVAKCCQNTCRRRQSSRPMPSPDEPPPDCPTPDVSIMFQLHSAIWFRAALVEAARIVYRGKLRACRQNAPATHTAKEVPVKDWTEETGFRFC